MAMIDHNRPVTRGGQRIRKTLQGLALIAQLAVVGGSPVFADTVNLNIEGQPLSGALNALADQTGVRLLFSKKEVARFKTNGISGEYSLERALKLLLAETDLEFKYTSENTLIVRKKAARSKAEPDSAMDIKTLEEIVVTATKREEGLMDVPIAISVLSAEQIRSTGSQSMQDLAGLIPNFTWPQGFSPAQADISIRGIYSYTSYGQIGLDQGFGIYLDGVYLGKQGSADLDLGEIERVEVLRGPQGTLFGKNTIAGAINVVSQKPGSEFESEIEVDVGNYGSFRLRSSVNAPVIEDVLAVRASFGKTLRDGYVTNLFDGDDDIENIDQISGRVQVGFTPSVNTQAYLNLDVLETDNKFYRHTKVPEAEFTDYDSYTINFENTERSKKENKGVSLTVEQDFPSGYSATAVTGYRDDQTFLNLDVDASPIKGLDQIQTTRQKMFSQELRLASPVNTWYDFVAGLYYFNQDNILDRLGVVGEGWLPTLTGTVDQHQVIDVASYAAFVHANMHLGERLTLFGGARYTRETKKFVTGPTICAPTVLCEVFYSGLISGETVRAPFDLKAEEPSWSIGLRYAFTGDLMAYGSIARGFKSGAFNDSGNPVPDHANGLLAADPEFVTAYEVGLKSNWMDQRLRVNAALFYMDYTDLQVRNFCPTCGPLGTGANLFSNAASVTSEGFEIEVSALPTEHLVFNVNVGYVNSVFDEYRGVSDPRPVSDGGLGNNVDASGNQLPNAPKWTGNVSAQHELPLKNGASWHTRLDYVYTSSRYTAFGGAVNTNDTLIPESSLWNMRVGYESSDNRWGVYLWGKNLTDEDDYAMKAYISFITNGFAVKQIEPRTYGMSVSYQF